MGTPGQDLISSGTMLDADKSRWNRSGIPVDGQPELISASEPPDSYDGAKKINTPERVDLVVNLKSQTNVKIKYRAD